MDKLLKILGEIAPGVDFETCNTLIDDEILDSFDILTLVSEIEDEFDVEIEPTSLLPQNFNSVHSIMALINKLKNM